jgi:hypothetical protein
MSTRDPSRRYDSVQQDWRAFLPEAKALFYYQHTEQLENSYVAFSISLNEALELRRSHVTAQSLQTLVISSELCSRLVVQLNSILQGIRQRGRHFGLLPNFAPLDSMNFKTELAQRVARSGNLLNRILLSEHSQFIQKVLTLENIVEAMEMQFRDTAAHLNFDSWEISPSLWRVFDQCHFDLNTCIRETVVLFKSFLFVLPEEQLEGLDFTIRGLYRSRPITRESAAPVFHPRRMGAAAGK